MADESKTKKVKARVLADLTFDDRKFKCNDILEADASEIKSLKEAGQVDDHASAVAYCERQAARAKAKAAAADEE
jgi:hypothetical protein